VCLTSPCGGRARSVRSRCAPVEQHHGSSRAPRHLPLDGPPALDDLRTDLRDLLGTERLVAYGLDQTETEISALSFLHTSHAVPRVERERFSRFVAVHPARWGLYNPVSPEPSQRNRVLA
jgi:hypothetical protein